MNLLSFVFIHQYHNRHEEKNEYYVVEIEMSRGHTVLEIPFHQESKEKFDASTFQQVVVYLHHSPEILSTCELRNFHESRNFLEFHRLTGGKNFTKFHGISMTTHRWKEFQKFSDLWVGFMERISNFF